MKKLIYLSFLIIALASCKKENAINPILTAPTQILKEDSTIVPPAFSAKVSYTGSKRSIEIKGDLKYISFTSRRLLNDGKAGFITYVFDLKFDTLRVTKYPSKIIDPTYTFKRNSAYNYTFTHDVVAGEDYSVILKGADFLADIIEFKY